MLKNQIKMETQGTKWFQSPTGKHLRAEPGGLMKLFMVRFRPGMRQSETDPWPLPPEHSYQRCPSWPLCTPNIFLPFVLALIYFLNIQFVYDLYQDHSSLNREHHKFCTSLAFSLSDYIFSGFHKSPKKDVGVNWFSSGLSNFMWILFNPEKVLFPNATWQCWNSLFGNSEWPIGTEWLWCQYELLM